MAALVLQLKVLTIQVYSIPEIIFDCYLMDKDTWSLLGIVRKMNKSLTEC